MSTKPDIRFIVSTKTTANFDDSRYLHVTANVVVVTAEGIRNPLFDSYANEGAGHLDGYQVTAQMDNTSNRFYGFRADFGDLYRVGLKRAESMVKVLRKIDRHLAKLDVKYGYVTDVSAFAARVADAIGSTDAHCFGIKSTNGWSHDDSGYRWLDTDGLRGHLDQQVKEWQNG